MHAVVDADADHNEIEGLQREGIPWFETLHRHKNSPQSLDVWV